MSEESSIMTESVITHPEKTNDPFPFTRFLAAKKSVDDRALNRQVWDTLSKALPPSSVESPLRILEVGAGIGTMIERIVEWDLIRYACYTALDSSYENIQAAVYRLQAWALARGLQVISSPRGLMLQDKSHLLRISFETADVQEFIDREINLECWDLLVAHAFLDLVDVPSTLPGLFRMLSPGGLFLFTINFDGITILEPVIDPPFDEEILNQYHQTMHDRIIRGEPSGDSRAGRHLFQHLKAAGAEILSAGASDWVVYSGPQGYFEDEAYFLHCIIHTIQEALAGHPQLDQDRFAGWIRERHAQIERGELVYIAHQIDFIGKVGAMTPLREP